MQHPEEIDEGEDADPDDVEEVPEHRQAHQAAAVGGDKAALADLHGHIEEGLSVSGIRLAKTMGTTRRDAARFTEVSHDLIDLEMRAQLAGRWRMATMQIVFAAIPAAIYLAAGLPATSGGMTIGTLIAFTTLQAGIFRPLMGLLNVGAQWVSSMALFSRVFEYLDLEPDVVPPADPVPLDPAAVRGDAQGVMPMPLDITEIPNNHLSYAIQWFSFAAICLGMTIALVWRIRRQVIRGE